MTRNNQPVPSFRTEVAVSFLPSSVSQQRGERMSMSKLLRFDPRWYQIGSLALLLTIGITRLGFDVTPARVALFVGVALATQFGCTRLWRLPNFDPKSALITSMSLSLLLRTGSTWIPI